MNVMYYVTPVYLLEPYLKYLGSTLEQQPERKGH